MDKDTIERTLIDFFESEDCDVDGGSISVRNNEAASVGDLIGAGLNVISLSRLAERLSELGG